MAARLSTDHGRRTSTIRTLSCCFTLLIGLVNSPLIALGEFSDLESYHSSLATNCAADTDCVVKDIGNCCGYLPKCLNKASEPSRSIVDKLCKDQMMVGICGVESIERCICQDNRCKPAPLSAQLPTTLP